MSFQAYLENIEAKTGMSADDSEAAQKRRVSQIGAN